MYSETKINVGRRCFNGVNNLTCECLAGFAGLLCETNTDECLSNPCLHAATCNDLVSALDHSEGIWRVGDVWIIEKVSGK